MKKTLQIFNVLKGAILLVIFSGLSLIGNSVFAQITMNISDFPHAGMLVVRNIDSTTAVQPGSAGVEQVWDFSNLVASYDDSTLYTLPSGQPGNQNFPQANLVSQDLDADINYEGGFNFIYYETSPDGWYTYGQDLMLMFWGININWHIIYNPAALILPLPFTYEDSYSQSFTWYNYMAMGYNGSITDTTMSVNHINMSQLADASGTMITPEGSYEVLRVHEIIESVDSTFTYNPTNGWTFSETSSSEIDAYRWYANSLGEVGYLQMDNKKDGGTITFFKSQALVGVPDISRKPHLQVNPNPASSTITIQSDFEINRVEVVSMSGITVLAAHNTKTLDVSGLSTGVYMLKIENKSGSETLKFVKQ
jgi:hypothetical protein